MIHDHLINQIRKLEDAHLSFDGWKDILHDHDIDKTVPPKEIFHLRIRACYLAKFFKICLEYYDTIPKVSDLAKLTLMAVQKTFSNLGEANQRHAVITSEKTLLRWFHLYHHDDCFYNQHSSSSKNKSTISPFLIQHPDIVQQITDFARSNLSSLTVELLHRHIVDTLIPKLVTKVRNETNNPNLSINQFLHQYYICSGISIETVWKWMRQLGFDYKPHKKCYYVDTHDAPENVKYRSKFIKRYFEYELCCHRWISFSVDERDKLIEEGKLPSEISGYEYEKFGMKMIEYHVDDHSTLQDKCKHLPFGGYLSVRKPSNKKKTMIIGQDECIFKQFLFSKNFWSLPDGTKQIIPKDEGHGVMLSSFCCRELGFGFEICDELLEKVNLMRKGQTYSDEAAAHAINVTSQKPSLTTSPFSRSFEYGNNHEGYWSYNHMVLQLEDCVDVLKTLYLNFDFIFYSTIRMVTIVCNPMD